MRRVWPGRARADIRRLRPNCTSTKVFVDSAAAFGNTRPTTGLFQDVRDAVCTLVKTPAFTVVVVLTLALGTGANAAILSLTDQVLLRM
jgi:hypothetical protein